jgi:hypothetical protein
MDAAAENTKEMAILTLVQPMTRIINAKNSRHRNRVLPVR